MSCRPRPGHQAIKRIEAIENTRLHNAHTKARVMGLPLRVEKPGGGAKELVDFVGDKPLFIETHNANAAISTAADLVRTSSYGSPNGLDGSGINVAVWDGGANTLPSLPCWGTSLKNFLTGNCFGTTSG